MKENKNFEVIEETTCDWKSMYESEKEQKQVIENELNSERQRNVEITTQVYSLQRELSNLRVKYSTILEEAYYYQREKMVSLMEQNNK